MQTNDRFPVLSIIAKVLWLVGVCVIAAGSVLLILELIEAFKYFTTSGAQWMWGAPDAIYIGGFVASLLVGLGIMAIAESIGVLFAIEKNTRK